jgi:hypothetical protein
MRLVALRIAAVACALTWLVLPGFGLADLSVSWDPDWPVVLEASWGTVMTVLVAGSFLAVAARPRTAAPALVVLGVTLATWIVSAAAGQEWELLGYAGLLTVETGLLFLVPGRERLRPVRWSVRPPLLLLALAAAVPWALHAVAMYRLNRFNVLEVTGDITMGVDHQAVQGGMALGLIALPLLAAVWPRGRRHLGVSVGLVAGYVGLVSFAFPGAAGGWSPVWSVSGMAWGVAVAVVSVVPSRLEPGELRGEVVESERAL